MAIDLDEGMGYDTPRRTFGPWPQWKLIALGAAVLLIIIFVIAANTGGDPEVEPPPAPAPTVTATPEEAHGHDKAGADRGAWTTANVFLNAWLSPDPKVRAKVFGQTAIPELAAGLEDTSPENVPAGHVSRMEVESASPYSVTFAVTVEDVDTPVVLLLTAGHSTGPASFDWRVTSVERASA